MPGISSPSGQELTQQNPNPGCFLFIHSGSFSLNALTFQESHSSLLNYPLTLSMGSSLEWAVVDADCYVGIQHLPCNTSVIRALFFYNQFLL